MKRKTLGLVIAGAALPILLGWSIAKGNPDAGAVNPDYIDDGGVAHWNLENFPQSALTPQPDGGAAAPFEVKIDVTLETQSLRDTPPDPPPPPPNLPPPPDPITPLVIPTFDHEPLNPFGYVPPPVPNGACSPGTGWSFEDGTLQGWSPSGVFTLSDNRPVFGNNVDINRMLPPGFIQDNLPDDAKNNVGGDYWRFSRDANQQGNWWIGSSDFRNDFRMLPGGRFNENLTGTLISPSFIVDSRYIHFVIGGTMHANERVDLEIPFNPMNIFQL